MRYLIKSFFYCLLLSGCCFSGALAKSVLSEKDADLYRDIFRVQEKADFKMAKNLTTRLKDTSLMGYVLYDRYFSKHYQTKKNEISEWLKKYKDLAVAVDVYALGKQKKVSLKGEKPIGIFGGNVKTCSAVFRPEPIDLVKDKTFSYLSKDRQKKAKKIMNQIYKYIRNGKTLSARKLVEGKDAKNLFSYYDHDSARTALAFSYFLDGEYQKSLDFAQQVIEHSGDKIPLVYWVAGLASWQKEEYRQAGDYFKRAAEHKKKYPLLEAAASVWAARSYLKTGEFEKIRPALEKAAQYQRLFYGIIAMRLLSQDLSHVWDMPSIPTDDVSANFSHPALNRFYALQQIGQKEWAGKELSKLYLEADDEAKGILLMISERNGFADDILALAGHLGDNSTRYPAPNWTPTDGWKVDKALVYAFVRQESCFNQRAESSMGALGLMQLMPDTARELAKNLQYPFKKQMLKEPEYNLSLGQNYLLKLINMPAVGNNLIYMAVAYNAGPGNLIKWKKQIKTNDPLLFLESIPSRETRSFAERIIVNYWIYRTLMGQPLLSLDKAVCGEWPNYQSMECQK